MLVVRTCLNLFDKNPETFWLIGVCVQIETECNRIIEDCSRDGHEEAQLPMLQILALREVVQDSIQKIEKQTKALQLCEQENKNGNFFVLFLNQCEKSES